MNKLMAIFILLISIGCSSEPQIVKFKYDEEVVVIKGFYKGLSCNLKDVRENSQGVFYECYINGTVRFKQNYLRSKNE